MISVILYGRNDSHGYNLHKRAAISLNCIAEVLTDPDDEILFTDYNTPNDLPTFIEAIYDTLTVRAKACLRVFRVRPELHAKLAGPTHLSALEPHSRNIALRRSNPRNHWVLLTNTDMIFVPLGALTGLSEAAAALADGQYILPRFELPEPLWESFPRSDPQAVMHACEELGRKLHLEEISVTYPYMRFDSPGDFQLFPRQALFDIEGFDERMIHGWHADANICKRLYLYYGGRSESLAERLKGYHCDHTRVATLAHRLDLKLENNPQEFVWGLEDPVAHHQAGSWGAPEEAVEEIDFTAGPQARYVRAVEHVLGAVQTAQYHSDANEQRNFVYYAPEHALPYLAANLTVYPRDARFLYAGNNPRMLQLSARAIAGMGFEHPLEYVPGLLTATAAPAGAVPMRNGTGGLSAAQRLTNYRALIFDFGLDPGGLDPGSIQRVTDWPRELRYSLGAVARCLETCAVESDSVKKAGGHIPDFLVLNANHYVFKKFIGQFLIAAETPFPTHVRKGRPRVGEERLYRSHAWKYTEDLMRSFFAYSTEEYSVAVVGPGQVIDFTSTSESARYKDGHWGAMDFTGTWIEGHCAAVVFAPPEGLAEDLLVCARVAEAFIGPEREPLRLRVFFEGEEVEHWTVYQRFEITTCKALLPGRLMAGKKSCRLEFRAENPQSVEKVKRARGEPLVGEDPRELSIKIQRLNFESIHRLDSALGATIDFTESGEGAWRISECFGRPDNLGTWTLGPDASLDLRLVDAIDGPVTAVFTITDAVVNDEHPDAGVLVKVNGRAVANWRIGTRWTEERRLVLPPDLLAARNPVKVEFHVESPRTPVELRWPGTDLRPLGFRLTKLRLSAAGSSKYRVGEVIDFTEGGNAIAFLGERLGPQWAPPDRYGSWTVGTEAAITLPFEEPLRTGVPACFIITDCAVSDRAPQLPVRVKVDGKVLAEWLLGPDREGHRRVVEIPAELAAGRDELTLALEIPEPRAPRSLGWGDDPRALGVRVARLAIGTRELGIPIFDAPPAPPRGMLAFARRLAVFGFHVARAVWRRLT